MSKRKRTSQAAGSALTTVSATREVAVASLEPASRDPLSRLTLYALCVFVFAAPYFQGLYFEKQRFVAEIVTFALGIVWLVATRYRAGGARAVLPRGGLGLSAIGVAAAYVIAIPGAASIRSALGEALTAGMLVAVMWLVAESATREQDLDLIIKVVGVSGVMITVVGMTTATKVFVYPSAWEGGRLFSTLQYANTAASALIASFFAVATAWLKATVGLQSRRIASLTAGVTASGTGVSGLYFVEPIIWGSAGPFAFAGFVLTQSRAAWLVFPVVAALFIVGVPWTHKAHALLYVVVSVVAGTVAATRFSSHLEPLNAARAWTCVLGYSAAGACALVVIAILCCLLSAAVGGRLASCPLNRSLKHNAGSRVLVTVIIAVGLILALAAGALLLGKTQTAGPLARLQSFALSDQSLQERIIWPLDAARIVLRHPITGTGGGGWALVYHKYKAYPYYTKLVHNHFAQVLVDTGLIGFFLFMAFWLCLLRAVWTTMRNTSQSAGLRTTVCGAGVAAAGLGLHGALDFSLSLPAVAVFLWAMAGVVYRGSQIATPLSSLAEDGRPRTHHAGTRGARLVSRLDAALTGRLGHRVALGSFALAILLTASLSLGGLYSTRAINAWAQRKPDEAISLLQRAATFDPLSASTRADLGQWYETLANAKRDRDLAKKALDSLAAAVSLSPYDAAMRLHYSAILFNSGQPDAALEHAKIAISNNRFLSLGYEVLTGLYVESGKRLALSGKPDEARKALTMGLDVLVALEKTNASIPERYRRFVLPEAQLKATPMMGVYRAQAKFFLGQREAMYDELKPALADADPVVKAKAVFWEAMMIAATGDHSTAGQKLKEALKTSPELANEGPRTKEIAIRLGLDYKLEPKTP
ncbi:MAG: hypothetical protein HPY55_03745 [Firmicutes bacterium]|nr:hypothetical protein [Bacillota bacterium]